MRIDACYDLLRAASLDGAFLVLPAPRLGWAILPGVMVDGDVIWSGARHAAHFAVRSGLFTGHSLGDRISRWKISTEGRAVLRALDSELCLLRDIVYNSSSRVSVSHDLAGTTAGQVALLLEKNRGTWMSRSEIGQRLEKSPIAITRALPRMRAMGIAYEGKPGFIRLPADGVLPDLKAAREFSGRRQRVEIFGEPFASKIAASRALGIAVDQVNLILAGQASEFVVNKAQTALAARKAERSGG